MDLKHKLLLGFMAAFGFVLLVHELQPKPVSSTRTPQMFEVLSSNFESRLSLDLRNLETGRIHRRVYAGKRCYGSPAKVGGRWELPAITDQYKDGSLRYRVDARSLCRR